MRLPFLFLALALAAAACPAAAAPPAPADRAALETLARGADEAWNRRDAAAMSAHYAPDANLLFAGMAEPVRGRGAIRGHFEKAFAARTGELRHITRITHLDLPRPGVAVSDADVVVERRGADGSWTPVRSFTNTSVAILEGRRWKLAAVRAQPVPAAR